MSMSLHSDFAIAGLAKGWAHGRFLETINPAVDYNEALVKQVYRQYLSPSAQKGGVGAGGPTKKHHTGGTASSAGAAGSGAGAAETGQGGSSFRQLLEHSSYLEYYLWPFFHGAVCREHLLSIILLINEKQKEGINLWQSFHVNPPAQIGAAAAEAAAAEGAVATATSSEDKFSLFLLRVLLLHYEQGLSLKERTAYVRFLAAALQSLEDEVISRQLLRCASLPLWLSLSSSRLEKELDSHPQLRKPLQRLQKEYGPSLQSKVQAVAAGLKKTGEGEGEGESSSSSSERLSGSKRARNAAGGAASGESGPADSDEETAEGGSSSSASSSFTPTELQTVYQQLLGSAEARATVQKQLDLLFIPSLLSHFFSVLESAVELPAAPAAAVGKAASAPFPSPSPVAAAGPSPALVRYLEQFLSFLLDLLSQLPTRRFLRSLLQDCHFMLRCRKSLLLLQRGGQPHSLYPREPAAAKLLDELLSEAEGLRQGAAAASLLSRSSLASLKAGQQHPSSQLLAGQEGRLCKQLLDMLEHSLGLPLDDQTGQALSEQEAAGAQYLSLQVLQRVCYKHFSLSSRALRDFSLAAPGPFLQDPTALKALLQRLSDEQLLSLAKRLRLLALEAEYSPSPSPSSSSASSASGGEAAPSLHALLSPSSTTAAGAGGAAATSGMKQALGLPLDRNTVLAVLLEAHLKQASQLEGINALPLFPSERDLWDANLVPSGKGAASSGVLALPKLNLQFLSFQDYLLRSLHLFRLESAYEVRCDLVDAVRRCSPRAVPVNPMAQGMNALASLLAPAPASSSASPASPSGMVTQFAGWSKMALPINSFGMKEVLPPRVGEKAPARVTAELQLDLSRIPQPLLRQEWDSLREHDVLFLLRIEAPSREGPLPPSQQLSEEEDFSFPQRYGIVSVRGCLLQSMRDEGGRLMGSQEDSSMTAGAANAVTSAAGGAAAAAAGRGSKRTLRVLLDPAQYHADTLSLRAAAGGAGGSGGAAAAGGGVYEGFNLLVRRKPESNNFHAVLQTMRQLMKVPPSLLQTCLPDWLQEVLLGYGDPRAAHYKHLPPGRQLLDVDMADTFVSAAHAAASFTPEQGYAAVRFLEEASGQELSLQNPEHAARLQPPFRVRFQQASGAGGGAAAAGGGGAGKEEAVIIPYQPLAAGPFPQDRPRSNSVAFTPVQVEAIRSGLNEGLTLIVGPPGTGKTDTAVQIISNLYHNFPEQRILLVTHSNQALNDLFEKIMARDIQEHHLLRLGAGEQELDTDKSFSKMGRVQQALTRRTELLQEVQLLGQSLSVPGDVGYTCETAEYFHLYHVLSRTEEFRARFKVPAPPSSKHWREKTGFEVAAATAAAGAGGAAAGAGGKEKDESEAQLPGLQAAKARQAYLRALGTALSGVEPAAISAAFPFSQFFQRAPGGLEAVFKNETAVGNMQAAEACIEHLEAVFRELAGYRAFELLRSQRARTDFMLSKQARIIAMTCTHAALARARLLELGFCYDTLVMEEAAQVLEVETFIPMMLQMGEGGGAAAGAGGAGGPGAGAGSQGSSRLKRVVLLGDHNQLPPVVQNLAIQKYSSMEQSMFSRFVRLGVPAVQLNAQGRARPSIASLYNWRYKQLGDLPVVREKPEYLLANTGFLHDYQLVDTPDFGGKGESCPMPFFYQNLGEAEFLVACYQYMRLCGYPAERISILTTYNGQKQLIRDVLRKRCSGYPMFGEPACVETVDKFQGQQNDYILLSLVRTRAVGHLRDVRRLVVALSRARLGLYVFCRASVFAGCYELAPAFRQLLKPTMGAGAAAGAGAGAGAATSTSQLKLVLPEQWPCARLSGGPLLPATNHLSVGTPEQMGAVVSGMLQTQASMWAAYSASAAAATAAASASAAASAGKAAAVAVEGQSAASTSEDRREVDAE